MGRQAGPRGYSEQTVHDRTGKSSEEWYAILDAYDVRTNGHSAAARYLQEMHGLNGWWAQMVSARYEWARGLRSEEVRLPAELEVAFAAEPALQEAFVRLTAFQRSRSADWIGRAVRPETRTRRLERTLDALREGRPPPAI